MEVNLAPEIEAVLHAKVAAGEYSSVAALIEEALFLLVERDWQEAQRNLRDQGGFGMLSPGPVSIPEVDQ